LAVRETADSHRKAAICGGELRQPQGKQLSAAEYPPVVEQPELADSTLPRGILHEGKGRLCVPAMPRISVIIPAYNCEAVLPEALRSVEAQTMADWEVVIGDDASTDGTAAVAEGFDERFRVVGSDRNRGPAGARNRAIEAAGGELLAFLDADDCWLPEYLAEQVAAYERGERERPGVGIVACDALIRGPDGFAPGTYRDRVPFPDPLTLAKLLVANPILVSALVPRAAVEKAGGFSPECMGTEDLDLWIRLLELGYRAVDNHSALAVYRVAEGSVSADVASMARNMQTVYRRALARGRLARRERRLARRELRLQRLVEELAEIRERRAADGRAPVGRVLRSAPRAAAITLENPQRWGRVARRVVRGEGSLRERLAPGREASLRV
jgi:teichuronic acid biosynthesis glycosyltransferase TuaG